MWIQEAWGKRNQRQQVNSFEKLFYKQRKWAKPERESGAEEDFLRNRLRLKKEHVCLLIGVTH